MTTTQCVCIYILYSADYPKKLHVHKTKCICVFHHYSLWSLLNELDNHGQLIKNNSLIKHRVKKTMAESISLWSNPVYSTTADYVFRIVMISGYCPFSVEH